MMKKDVHSTFALNIDGTTFLLTPRFVAKMKTGEIISLYKRAWFGKCELKSLNHTFVSALLFLLCNIGLAQGFTNVSADFGLDYPFGDVNYGGGVSFADFNQDGWDDLTFTSGPGSPMHFHQNTGSGFIELEPMVDNTTETKQPIWVDYDNDGDMDLWISSYQLNRLYRNDGDMQMVDVTTTCGFDDPTVPSFNGSWLDYDRDGFLDLVTAHRLYHLVGDLTLYHNMGDGTFEDATDDAGLGGGVGNSVLAIATLDFNNDGWEDIFVGQDYQAGCLLFKNMGDGTFDNISVTSNANIMNNTMTATVGDYNNDGFMDIFITDTGGDGCSLLQNQGDETFLDVANPMGVILYHFTWGASFFDADNDMDLDLHVDERSGAPFASRMFENMDAGESFIVSNDAWGMGNDDDESIGNAVGDYNNDGYPELVKNNTDGTPNSFWRNDFSDNNYISIDLEGVFSNRKAIGAVIQVTAGGIVQMRRVGCGEGFCSQHSYTQFFGLGANEVVNEITVKWPSGMTTTATDISSNQRITINEMFGCGYYGCTDTEACNYDSDAEYDDGSCEYPEELLDCDGYCLNDQDNDEVCDENEIAGCTDDAACNFDPGATESDNSCIYAEMFYDCNNECLLDTDGDGICNELEVAGCTDSEACNYNSAATDEDGSCELVPAYAITGEVNPASLSLESYTYNTTPGSTYLWVVEGGTIISGQASSAIEVMWNDEGAGAVSVTETSSTGCVGPLVSLEIDIATTVDEVAVEFIHIYPNPASDILFIETKADAGTLFMELYNSIGQLVHHQRLNQTITVIDVTRYSCGYYQAAIRSENGLMNLTVIFD